MIYIFAGDYRQAEMAARILEKQKSEWRALQHSHDVHGIQGTVVCWGTYYTRTMMMDRLKEYEHVGNIKLFYLGDGR